MCTHSCPTLLPPPPPPQEDFTSPHFDCPARDGLVTALLPPPWQATPGARGTAPALVEFAGTSCREGGTFLLMAHSAPTAFGGCCSACPRGPPVHRSVSCWGSSHHRVWGGLVPCCLAACIPLDLVLFFLLLVHSPLLVCTARGGGGGVTPCLPLWLLGCPTLIWMAPGAPATSAHVSNSAD